jgi:phospholipid transport system transporter-binding protein
VPAATITFKDNILVIDGELNFQTIPDLWQASLPLLTRASPIVIDCAGIAAANSGALALLLEWIKYAKEVQKPLQFKQLSPQILSIAEIAGIKDLIQSYCF